MKLILVSIVLCAAIYIGSARKLLTASSRHVAHRETNLLKRLVKRQAYNDPNCDRRACATPHCGKDYVATTLPNECCERCIPWEYANSLGIPYSQGSQSHQDPRNQQHNNDPYNQYPYNQQQQPQYPQQQQQPQYPQQQHPQYPQQPQYAQSRVDVYIYGPDEGARVSSGQSIYFDCEVNAAYNQNAQPHWSRSGNQPLPYKAQSTPLAGNRKIARLTIPDATPSDGGRYECSGGTGNPSDQASIDLQVTDGGYYPQPQPQPQPQYPNYDPYNQYPYNQYPYNQPGYYPQQPEPQPQPQPQPDADEQHGNEDDGENDDGQDGNEAEDEEPAAEPSTQAPAPSQDDAEGGGDEGEYPEDYSDSEK